MFSFLTESLFPAVLNMSVTAGIVVLFVLIARLLLKKAPKIFSYALWAVVLFRLLCPVSVTADFSLLGLMNTSASPVTEHTGIVEHIPVANYEITPPALRPSAGQQTPPAADDTDSGTASPGRSEITTLPPAEQTTPVDVITPSTDPKPQENRQTTLSITAIAGTVWLTGIAAMLIYSAVSLLRLRNKLRDAAKLRGNIYLSDHISTPFVMGLLPAKIYLPSTLTEQEQRYILLHEQHHIRRLDHIIKLLAFLALCSHWFNPLVWLAFVLSVKDMEMSCDEAVMKQMDSDIRAEYSASLLSLATGRRIISGTPLAFGEGSTASRIRNILNWKKPKAWLLPIAAVLCVAVVVFCAVNPVKTDTQDTDPPEQTDSSDLGDDQSDTEDTSTVTCDHTGFRIAFDSQPTRTTVVDWFFDHDLLTECADCKKSPFDLFAAETSFSDCLEGLKSGKYDVAILPCNSDMLASLEGYTAVPIQRDAVIFVRSNASDLVGYDLTDEQIRRAFTSGETVYWNETQTDPIIPAAGWHDSATLWQQVYRLFGFSPASPNVVFITQGQDNATQAIEDSGRGGSGLWPYYFSGRSGEAALNGEPISVNGVYPSAETIADGSYPYSFTYYAVFSPTNTYAEEIGDFVSYVRTANYDLFETMDTLRFLPMAWESSFNRYDGYFSIVGLYEGSERPIVVNGILLQCLRAIHDQLYLPMDPNSETIPCGIRIDIGGSYQRTLILYPEKEFPCVRIYMESAGKTETSAVYSPQLHLYLTALQERENATLEDPDSDGFFEAFVWDYQANDLVIYDYYDGSIRRISTNETIGCSSSNYTGLVANILPGYRNMVQAQNEDGQVSVYRYKNGTFTYVCPMRTALGQDTGAALETISYQRLANGVLYQPGSSIVVVSGGAPVRIQMTDAQVTVVHNGWEILVEYSWASCGDTLAAVSYSGHYSVIPLNGSDRYLELILDMGYTYLIDTVTGEVLDPLAVLDKESKERLSIISFSPDGQYAVVSHHSSTACILLNCATGEITDLPYADDIYSISGYMIDATHIMLISAFETEYPHITESRTSIYNIATGELTDFPSENLTLLSGQYAYTKNESGYIVLINQLSGERLVTEFTHIEQIQNCPGGGVLIISDGVLYRVAPDGSTTAVCRAERT